MIYLIYLSEVCNPQPRYNRLHPLFADKLLYYIKSDTFFNTFFFEEAKTHKMPPRNIYS